jgi:hypothetical protein
MWPWQQRNKTLFLATYSTTMTIIVDQGLIRQQLPQDSPAHLMKYT